MNKNNRKLLWQSILNAGDSLEGKLPSHANHPKGRNSYAHVAICIKHKFKCSYKDIDDNKLNKVLDYIKYLVDNPK